MTLSCSGGVMSLRKLRHPVPMSDRLDRGKGFCEPTETPQLRDMEMPARRTHRQGGPRPDGRPCWATPPRQGSANRPSPAPGHRAARPAPGSSSAAASRRARPCCNYHVPRREQPEHRQFYELPAARHCTALLLSLDAPRMSTRHAAGRGRPVSGWRFAWTGRSRR